MYVCVCICIHTHTQRQGHRVVRLVKSHTTHWWHGSGSDLSPLMLSSAVPATATAHFSVTAFVFIVNKSEHLTCFLSLPVLSLSHICSSLFSLAIINIIWLKYYDSLQGLTPLREIRAGTQAGIWGQRLKQRPMTKSANWLTLTFLYDQNYLSKDGTPTSMIKQENAPQACLQSNLMEVVTQLRYPFQEWL